MKNSDSSFYILLLPAVATAGIALITYRKLWNNNKEKILLLEQEIKEIQETAKIANNLVQENNQIISTIKRKHKQKIIEIQETAQINHQILHDKYQILSNKIKQQKKQFKNQIEIIHERSLKTAIELINTQAELLGETGPIPTYLKISYLHMAREEAQQFKLKGSVKYIDGMLTILNENFFHETGVYFDSNYQFNYQEIEYYEEEEDLLNIRPNMEVNDNDYSSSQLGDIYDLG